MEGMGLKLTPVLVRYLLSPLGLFGPIADVPWTYDQLATLNSVFMVVLPSSMLSSALLC